MQKILVLGGTRFFGKQLVKKLLAQGKQVTIATRGLTQDDFAERVGRLIIDRRDQSSLLKAFKNKSWDVVYDQSCYTPQEASDAIQSLKGKIGRYIFTSSQAVYDFGTKRKEEDFKPMNYSFSYKMEKEYRGYKGYQEGKRSAESLLFQHNEFEVVSVRFPIVIGKGDHTKRLHFLVKGVLNGEQIGISKEINRYSFIDRDEAARFLYEMGLESSYSGPINPGCREDLSLREIVRLVELRVKRNANLTNKSAIENMCPYELEGSCSVNTDRSTKLGYEFSDINMIFNNTIDYYLDSMK